MTKPLSVFSASILAFTGFLTSTSAQSTGFNQNGAGPFDYDETTNWVAGAVNGIWDSSLTLLATQTVTVDSDLDLGTGWTFEYAGNFDLNLQSDGLADRTVTLGGDVLAAPVSNRIISIGSETAGQGLSVDLGGVERSFTVANAKRLRFLNTISNGNLVITGGSPTASGGTLEFDGDGASAAGSNIEVNSNATLEFDSSTSGDTGTTRAQDVTLKSGGGLFLWGNGGADSVETIGDLVIDGSGARGTSSTNRLSSVSLRPGSRNIRLTVASLERVDHGTVFFRGNNLGANAIASATGSATNIEITGPAPTLVGGGGAADTTTISILPWAVGGTTYSSGVETFVTYTAANGIRPLNLTTEFAGAFGGNATDNVRLTGATVQDTDVVVNSLLLGASGASLSGTGTITVTSGAVLLTRTTGAASPISANLNFGAAEGIIGYVRGDEISGTIAGSGGLTVHGNRNDERISFSNGASTYTGDTVILSNAMVAGGFLPSGDRTGDVIVYGNLQLNVGGFSGTINGLHGNGRVAYGNSGSSTLAIGDNDATSTFDGAFATNSNLAVSKVGDGVLTLNGDSSVAGSTTVSAGTLLINGNYAGGGAVTVQDATLGGSGTVSGLVTTTGIASTLSPGNSPGTLTLDGGLNAAAGATFVFELGSSSDVLDLGAGTFTGSSLADGLVFEFSNSGGLLTGNPYTLITFGFASGLDYSDLVASLLPAGYMLDSGFGTDGFQINGTDLQVQFSVIPEPSTTLLLAGGLGALLVLRRRRQ